MSRAAHTPCARRRRMSGRYTFRCIRTCRAAYGGAARDMACARPAPVHRAGRGRGPLAHARSHGFSVRTELPSGFARRRPIPAIPSVGSNAGRCISRIRRLIGYAVHWPWMAGLSGRPPNFPASWHREVGGRHLCRCHGMVSPRTRRCPRLDVSSHTTCSRVPCREQAPVPSTAATVADGFAGARPRRQTGCRPVQASPARARTHTRAKVGGARVGHISRAFDPCCR